MLLLKLVSCLSTFIPSHPTSSTIPIPAAGPAAISSRHGSRGRRARIAESALACSAALFLSLCSLSPASPASAATIATVVLTGDTAPDTGGAFQYFIPPLVNDSGEVLVVGGNAVLGAWIAGESSLDTVVLNGDVVDGFTLGPLQAARIANDGTAGAFHPATDTNGSRDSIWRGAPGSYGLAAIEDEDGDPFASILNDYLLFDDGSVAINVTSTPFPFPRAYYIVPSGGGAPALVAQELAPAPGTATTFEDLPTTFVGNEAGGILFLGEVVAANSVDDGLWYGTSAATTLVARQGDPVPGLTGETYAGFNNLMVADTGEVGFWFTTNAGTWGIMTGTPGNLSIAVKTDDLAPVPGVPDADYLAFQTPGSRMSGSGDLVFVATIAGTNVSFSNSETIFSIIDDVVFLEAREGDPAPGVPGATFTGLDTPLINDLGQVVFTADVSTGESGIWLADDTGLELIALTGELFDVGGGDLREIADFGLRTEPHLHEGALGDGGHIAFQLYFDDGSSGLFTAVPEPAVSVGLLLGASFLGGLRRGRRSRPLAVLAGVPWRPTPSDPPHKRRRRSARARSGSRRLRGCRGPAHRRARSRRAAADSG